MSKLEVVYLPIGVGTFHLESAQKLFEDSIKLLKKIFPDVKYPRDMLLELDKLRDFTSDLNPSLLIVQNITFANAAYMNEIMRTFRNCDVLLWTLREPVIDGGRLRLNSLTGAYSAANSMHNFGCENFQYVYGSPEEIHVYQSLKSTIKAATVKQDLKNLRIASVGHTPEGFGFGQALDSELLNTFGVTQISVEARELMQKANSYVSGDYENTYQEADSKLKNLYETKQENMDAFIRLYKAYEDFVDENNIGAIASRCWPDYFTEYGTPVCAVLGMLNDKLKIASCETDIYGALSMYIGSKLTDSPTFFGDPVSLSEDENTITFWHCGTAACSLAHPAKGAELGVHPNRKIGPTMEFGVKPVEKATVFRVGRRPDGSFRFFVTSGSVLDKPKQFSGTSLVFKTAGSAKEIIHASVQDGWEPHFAIVYEDVIKELKILADMLDLDIYIY